MRNFIPKAAITETITVCLPIDLLTEIDYNATAYNISRNSFISQCISYAIEHMSTLESETEKRIGQYSRKIE